MGSTNGASESIQYTEQEIRVIREAMINLENDTAVSFLGIFRELPVIP